MRREICLNSYLVLRRFLTSAIFTVLFGASASAQPLPNQTRSGIIGPGDVLRVRIWREPDMSGDFQVTSTGQVTLPRLGLLNVGSLPADSLQAVLVEKYKVYLNNPSIEVLLLRRVSVTGAVRNPGVY